MDRFKTYFEDKINIFNTDEIGYEWDAVVQDKVQSFCLGQLHA